MDPSLEAALSAIDAPEPTTTPQGHAAKKTRSKEGCLVCRARRIKCDNVKPECDRCVKYGAECVYPEKRRFDSSAIQAALSSRHKKPSRGPDTQRPSLDTVDIDAFIPLDQPFMSSPGLSAGTYPTVAPPLGPPPALPLSLAPPEVINSDIPDMPPLFTIEELMAFFRQTQMGAFYRQRVDPPDFLRPAFPDPDELRAFHHCVTYSFSICVTREEFNPWVQHIAPLFLFPDGKTPLCADAVRYAMLSTGAAHLAYLDHRDPNTNTDGSAWRALMHKYRTHCVSLLRQAKVLESEYLSDVFIAASAMLMISDVLSASVEWREIHRMLRGSIIRRRGLAEMLFGPADLAVPLQPSSLRKYLVEQVAFLELMAAHVQHEVPLLMLGGLEWFDKLGTLCSEDDQVESIQAQFGVHRSMYHLAVLTAIYLGRASRDRSNEYHLLTHPSPPLPSATREAGQAVYADLHAWKARLESSPSVIHGAGAGVGVAGSIAASGGVGSSGGIPSTGLGGSGDLAAEMDERTRIGSLAYYSACIILLSRDLLSRPRSDEAVQREAREIMRLVGQAGDKIEFMMWPLMVAATVLTDAPHRAEVQRQFRSFQYQCCYESEGTLRIVEEVWKRVDEGRDERACDWNEVMLEMGLPLLIG